MTVEMCAGGGPARDSVKEAAPRGSSAPRARSLEEIRQASAQKLETLKRSLASLDGALVAFSGGVDSTFLLALAREALGDRAVAAMVFSPTMPRAERAGARELASRLGARLLEVESHEMDDPLFVANRADRCYVCKRSRYRLCVEVARREGLTTIIDGFNSDDRSDYRPGQRAAEELGVRSPLAEADFGKYDIRAWSEALGLPTWSKPQLACLATRLPYGTEITVERLDRIERAEAAVAALGFHTFRVRFHGEIGRLEIADGEMESAVQRRAELSAAIREAGFEVAVVDLEPFRSGRMNELAGLSPESRVDRR